MEDKINFSKDELIKYLFKFTEYREGLNTLTEEDKELISQYIKYDPFIEKAVAFGKTKDIEDFSDEDLKTEFFVCAREMQSRGFDIELNH